MLKQFGCRHYRDSDGVGRDPGFTIIGRYFPSTVLCDRQGHRLTVTQTEREFHVHCVLGIVCWNTDLNSARRDGGGQLDLVHYPAVCRSADEYAFRLNRRRHIPSQRERREAVECSVNGG